MEGMIPTIDDAPSPRDKTTIEKAMESMGALSRDVDPIESRLDDPEVQATMTDFLDFTEYLPSDTIRSMTLVSNLDNRHRDAADKVDGLIEQWRHIPNLPADHRPNPTELRAGISNSLNQAVSTRVFSHAEALRIQENVTRHHNRAKYILGKLQTMLDTYPTEEEQQKSPVAATKSPSVVRAKAARVVSKENKMRGHRVPRITVPGDVLAPFEINYDVAAGDMGDDSSGSSDDDDIEPSASPQPPKRGQARVTPAPQPRIKIVKTPKSKKASKVSTEGKPKKARPAIPVIPLSKLKPPPDDAVIGSPDAPWLQLTVYELAKLRKRMKKNSGWAPSETMVARELKILGRGPEDFKVAKKKAEEEGGIFDPVVPVPVVDAASGVSQLPPGAISAESAASSEVVPTSNRGMKLNEAKKLKRETMAKQAAQEAEESAQKVAELAKSLMSGGFGGSDGAGASGGTLAPGSTSTSGATGTSPSPAEGNGKKGGKGTKKRKRDSTSDADPKKTAPDAGEAPASNNTAKNTERPTPAKRAKTETPIPPPHLAASTATGSHHQPEKQVTPAPPPAATTTEGAPTLPPAAAPSSKRAPSPAPAPNPPSETPIPAPQRNGITLVVQSKTPVPIPRPPHPNNPNARKVSNSPPAPASVVNGKTGETDSSGDTIMTDAGSSTLNIPLKPPHETPVPLPIHSPKKTSTPIHPPIRERSTRLESKKATADRKTSGTAPALTISITDAASATASALSSARSSILADSSPPKSATPGPELPSRLPPSRGVKASSQEPNWASLAADRPRRASTARNTPEVNSRPSTATQRRTKRPAPGVVSTASNGSNSAVGRRKAATRKKAKTKKDKDAKATGETVVMEEVDDEGNVIDSEEPRYCLCNRVSFGMMIECENSECKVEWFHLECVGLAGYIPARTTKWYCPECRKALNIGERGEVNARGIKT